MLEFFFHGPDLGVELTLGFWQFIIPALIGAAGSMGAAKAGKPDIPRQPSIGGNMAFGNQNPAVMQMLSALMQGQASQGATNQASQQQLLQQLMMAMQQPPVQPPQPRVNIGPVQTIGGGR